MPNLDFGKLSKAQKIIWPILIGALVVGAFVAFPLLFDGKINGDIVPEPVPPVEEPEAELPVSLEIICVGDIMIHEPQLASQYDPQTGIYNYENNFQYVKKYIEQADLALGNFEGTFGGPPYRGYPAFSAPDELASALKNNGFDVVITANNHMVDRGHDGVLRTLEVLQKEGLSTSGSRQADTDPNYSISEAEGVKIGVVAYTYETSGSGPEVSINGNYISQETASKINSFSYNRLDADLVKIKDTVHQAREAGAQVILLYLHWGEEYQSVPNLWQEQIVNHAVNDMQVDVIFASHPHVLQKMEMVSSEMGNRKVPVFYSMGNFISNQRQETLQNRFTEQGMIARVNLDIEASSGKILDIRMDAIPTWVDRYGRNGKTVYEVIPLDEEMESNPALLESGHLTRAREAREDINGILELY